MVLLQNYTLSKVLYISWQDRTSETYSDHREWCSVLPESSNISFLIHWVEFASFLIIDYNAVIPFFVSLWRDRAYIVFYPCLIMFVWNKIRLNQTHTHTHNHTFTHTHTHTQTCIYICDLISKLVTKACNVDICYCKTYQAPKTWELKISPQKGEGDLTMNGWRWTW